MHPNNASTALSFRPGKIISRNESGASLKRIHQYTATAGLNQSWRPAGISISRQDIFTNSGDDEHDKRALEIY